MKTGFSLLVILHRENPVFITGMGLQYCGIKRDRAEKDVLKKENDVLRQKRTSKTGKDGLKQVNYNNSKSIAIFPKASENTLVKKRFRWKILLLSKFLVT